LETQASSKHTENFKNITPLVNKLKQRIIYTWPYRKTPGKNLLALILAAGLGGLLGFYLGPVLLIGSIIGAILGIGLGAASGILFENNFPGAIKGSIPSTVLAIAVAIPLFFIFGTNPLVLIAMVIAAAAAGALVVSLAHQDFVHRINQDTHKDWQHSYQAISSKDDEQLLSKANLDMHYRGPLASTAKPLVKDPIVTPSHIVTLTS